MAGANTIKGLRSTMLGSCQRGQAMVFVSVFMVVVLIGVLFVFQAGKLTSEKMQVQNAADSVAFSLSTMEARDLNFMSYTNRAMVANEVAVAQMVGLLSWADYATTVPTLYEAYISPLYGIPIVGQIIAAVMRPYFTAVRIATRIAKRVVNAIAPPIVTVVSKINTIALGNAQKFFHFVTVGFMAAAIPPLTQQNADGATLSDFGFLALLLHVATYVDFYRSSSRILDPFVTSYNPNPRGSGRRIRKDIDGYKRLSALIRASRDPFTTARGWRFGIPVIPYNSSPFHELGLTIGLTRAGGTELRFIGSSRRAKGRLYNWSSADIMAAFVELILRFKILIGPWVNLSQTVDLPFGAGAAQAPARGRILLPSDMLAVMPLPLRNRPLPDGKYPYNDAPKYPLSWLLVAAKISTTGRIGRAKYQGLPTYSDTTRQATWGFVAPFLLVGVVKDVNDKTGRPNAKVVNRPGFTGPAGRFSLIDPSVDDEGADNEVAAIAKSEVYFKRPNDLNYFRRADGKTEYGSAFNPYWQARLVKTDYATRMLSLLFQQKQIYIDNLNGIQLPPAPQLPLPNLRSLVQ